jgi:hypothetical protein
MAGAKWLGDTEFIVVPAGAVRPAVVCSRHCIALHHDACRGGGGLQARRKRRQGLQVPEVFWLRRVLISWWRLKACEWVLSVVPLRPGDRPSFYRPRRRQFTGVPHCFIYVWRHSVQCCGVDSCPGESCFWRTSWRVLYPSRSGLEGGGVGVTRSVAARTLIRGCRWREAVRGTAAGVATSRRRALPQRRGWRCSGRDGVVMAGVSAQDRQRRRGPVPLAWCHGVVLGKRGIGVRSPFEGFAILFRGRRASVVWEWAAQCHGTDAGHAAQCRTVTGMASSGELAEQRRGVIPRRVRGVAWIRLWPRRLQMSVY